MVGRGDNGVRGLSGCGRLGYQVGRMVWREGTNSSVILGILGFGLGLEGTRCTVLSLPPSFVLPHIASFADRT